jgi:hypothetical protein
VGTYTIKDGIHPDRIKGCYKSSLEKSSSVIDEAVYRSMHVPSFYYQPPMELYKERSPTVRIRAESEKEKELKMKKWERVAGPSPVAYNQAESYEKTQAARTQSVKFVKDTKIPKFTEIAAKSNKWVPPVGSYNVTEKVYDKILSRPKGYK